MFRLSNSRSSVEHVHERVVRSLRQLRQVCPEPHGIRHRVTAADLRTTAKIMRQLEA